MYKKYCSIIILLLCGTSLFCQSSIYGNILDIHEKKLFGVNIYLEGTNFGAVSNRDGSFEIKKIPNGSYRLKLFYLGYKEQTIDILLEETKPVFFKIVMDEQKEILNEVIIEAKSVQQLKQEKPIKVDIINVAKIMVLR